MRIYSSVNIDERRINERFPEVVFGWSMAEIAILDAQYGGWKLPLNLGPLGLPAFVGWVQLLGAGVDFLQGHPIMESDVIITNAKGVGSIAIAEWVLGVMLAHQRCLFEFKDSQRKKEWPKVHTFTQELYGKTVGILGYGSIGTRVAKICSSLDMKIIGIDVKSSHCRYANEEFLPQNLQLVLPRCDFFVISVPLTPKTEGMVGQEELHSLKDGALLINVARGKIIDEEALIEELKTGRIDAALDVFTQIPLPADSPLWDMQNVFISPYCAVNTHQYRKRFELLFMENLKRYIDNRPLLNVVDKKKGF